MLELSIQSNNFFFFFASLEFSQAFQLFLLTLFPVAFIAFRYNSVHSCCGRDSEELPGAASRVQGNSEFSGLRDS
jgi:hypothetical protein